MKAQRGATTIKHSDVYNPIDNVESMKYTKNLVENSRVSSLKNAPIKNSDKQMPRVINPYRKFKGQEALPTFKRDLQAWSLVCT